MSSLIIGRFDLLDPASPIILNPDSFSRGAGVPSVSEIQSTVLDGAVVTGRAANNRSMTFPVRVRGNTRLQMAALANEFLTLVDSGSWTASFTPTGGLPVVYTCYRATVELTSTLLREAVGWQEFTVTCEASPYGASVGSQSVSLVGSTTVVDSFDTLPTVTSGPDSRQSCTVTPSITTYPVYDGTHALAVLVNYAGVNHSGQVQVSRSLSVAVTQPLTTVTVEAQQTWSYPAPVSSVAYATTWTLAVVIGGVTFTASAMDQVQFENYTPITFTFATPLPVGTITSYTLTTPIFSNMGSGGGTVTSTLYLDFLWGVATTAAKVSSANGSFLTIPKVLGSARTQAAVAVARTNASNFTAWCVHCPPADRPNAQPLIPLSGSTATYTTGPSVRYAGSYSVWAAVSSGPSGGTGTLIVSISQSLPAGGPSVTFPSQVHAGSLGGVAVVSFLYLGEVSLPLTDFPVDAQVSTTFTASSSSTAANLLEILLLDTQGQTVLIGSDAPSYPGAWVDIPAPGRAMGPVSSGPNRAGATSLSAHMAAGAALNLNPGASNILIYCPSGPLAVTLTYTPRWLQEATA